jgi:hypothetical protein
MKSLLLLLVTFPLWTDQPTMEGITKAISTGNAAALEPYLDNSVEIAILDQEDVYAKTQAVQVLKTFFGKNKPTTFSQMHQGQSRGKESVYCIGNLATASGNFRVYIYMRVDAEKYFVQEMRFDKE